MPSIEISEFVTIEGIPLCETGIDYPASTGNTSLTTQMFASAVEFAHDPHGRAPRVKIAHVDNPINADLQSIFELYNSERDGSEPALGTILNLRTENDGHTLIGDWYGIPEWMAYILATAYPARSIEGGPWQNPANQKKYDFVIDACALLGVVAPGCTSLADLQELFSASGPKVTVIEMSRPKTKMGGTLRVPVAMQVNVEDIRRAFYSEFAQGDRYWWWDRELLSDPWEFICSDENGDLWRVPFSVEEDADGDTIVSSWGEPEAIKIQYTSDAKRAGDQVAAMMLVSSRLERAGIVLAVNNEPFRKKGQKEAKPAMGIDISALRAHLNITEAELPDDATEEQINAALAAEPSKGDDEGSEGDPQVGEMETIAAEIKAGRMVVVSSDVWEKTRKGAELAIEQSHARDRADNEAFLEKAVLDGRISRSSVESYLVQMNGPDDSGRGPARDALRAMISTLPAGMAMAVGEVGHSGGSEDFMSDPVRGTGLFPKLEQAREERARLNNQKGKVA